ncbi:hypothetical protein BgiBS90_009335 [Biomphalaria glabrata]|nr:hypothetical protein BgiBS90_009335 [Biomphalaria glabrata]
MCPSRTSTKPSVKQFTKMHSFLLGFSSWVFTKFCFVGFSSWVFTYQVLFCRLLQLGIHLPSSVLSASPAGYSPTKFCFVGFSSWVFTYQVLFRR